MNVTIMYILVALVICIVLLTLETSRNKNKLRDLELRFEATDGFIDRCHDKIAQLIHELQVLEGTQSKMADELLKINDLEKRISFLEYYLSANIDQPYNPLNPSRVFYGLDGAQVNNKEEE